MSFDVNNFISNFMNNIGRITGNDNNTKEAEKNMQAGQQQYLNYTETPDDDIVLDVRKKYLNHTMYGIPGKFDGGEEYDAPEPTRPINVKYGIARIEEPTVEPTPIVTPEPSGPISHIMYGIAPIIEPTVEPTPVVTPEPTGIVSLYAVPMPTPTMIVEPTPQPIVTPQPMPQPQPMPIRPSNPWRINVRNIFLNMFGGENSSFAQRAMNVFDNFFSRWR